MDAERFSRSFARVANSSAGIPRFRETILHLAVQGKLTPRDPNDEPASTLLNQISKEREQLSGPKGIKKKKLPPILDQETPFKLPNGWQWARFGTLTKAIEYGTNFKASAIPNGVPVLRMNNIRDGRIDYENLKYVPADVDDLPELFIRRDDILFNRTNSFELVGKSAVYKGNDSEYTFASYLIRATLYESAVPDYVNLAMNAPYFRETQIVPQVVQQCGQANFNGTKLSQTLVPLPPRNEQLRIVERVTEFMLLCDELDSRQQRRQEVRIHLNDAALDRLITASDPAEFAAAWQRVRDNFDLLYAVPENVAKLRQAILQLAVRGKLVPQNPNDEPAAAQLGRVAAIKRGLQAAGQLQKDKKPSAVKRIEPAFAIPTSWEWTRLQDLFEIWRGSSPRPAGDPRFFGGDIPWITVGEITKDTSIFLDNVNETLTTVGSKRSRFVSAGDLLLTNSGATLGFPRLVGFGDVLTTAWLCLNAITSRSAWSTRITIC
jgi:type I restriction enzyme S subunit